MLDETLKHTYSPEHKNETTLNVKILATFLIKDNCNDRQQADKTAIMNLQIQTN